MITVLIIAVILSLIGNIFLLYFGIRAVQKNEALSDYISKFDAIQLNTLNSLETMLDTMREIDMRGSFESDDEVGVVFNELKNAIIQYKKSI